MSMERTSKGLASMGDADLVAQFAPIQAEFVRRHPGLSDIPLTGRLPGETSRLDPSLEGKLRITPLEIGGRDFKTPITEIAESFAITDDLTVKKTKGILEKVRKGSAQISPESQQLLSELLEKGINISSYSLHRLRSPKFTTLPQTEHIEIADAKAGDLVPNPKGTYATTEEIWTARDENGLGPVGAETALHFLLQKGDQLKMGEWIVMSMEPLADRDGYPGVFRVERRRDGLWLDSDWTKPSSKWGPGNRFAFSLPQVTTNA